MVFNSHKFRNQVFLLAPQYREFDEPERPSEGKGRSFLKMTSLKIVSQNGNFGMDVAARVRAS